MKRNVLGFYSLLLFLLLSHISGKGQTNSLYADPEEIWIINKLSINQAVVRVFSKAELCHMKKGFAILTCDLGANGKIIAFPTTRLKDVSIEAKKIDALKVTLKKMLLFHIPNNLIAADRNQFRGVTIVIPFKTYCK